MGPKVLWCLVASAVIAIVAVVGYPFDWGLSGVLLALPGVALFTRLEESTVLSHDLRRRLYESVHARPGISPQDLVTTHDSAWSTVMYHLRVLERHGLVVAVRDGRYRRFFETQSGRWANGRKLAMATMQNPTTAEIAHIVSREPGIVQRRIARRLGLAPSSVSWHVRRLERVALLERRREGDGVRLVPGTAWAALEHAPLGA